MSMRSSHASAQAFTSRSDTCDGKDTSSVVFGNRSSMQCRAEASPAKCSSVFSAGRKRHDSPRTASKVGVTATHAGAAGAPPAAHDDQQQSQQQHSPWRPPALVMPISPEPMADADAREHDQEKPLTPLHHQGTRVASSPLPKYWPQALMAAATAPLLEEQPVGTASQQQPMLPASHIITAELDTGAAAAGRQQQQRRRQQHAFLAPDAGETAQRHRQQWPQFAAMPAAMPSLAVYKPQPQSACLQLQAAGTAGSKQSGVRAAATLLGSGECTPECLSPVISARSGPIAQHAAALGAALWSSRLQ